MMNKTQMASVKKLTATLFSKASSTNDTGSLYTHFANMADQKTRIEVLVETLESEVLESCEDGGTEGFDGDIYGEALLYLNEDYPSDKMVLDLIDEFIGAVHYYKSEYNNFYCSVLEDLTEALSA